MSKENTTDEIIEFKITPTNEIYYSEDTAFGVYTFLTENEIPYCREYSDSPFKNTKTSQKIGDLVGKMQRLYIGSEYNVKAKIEFNQKYNRYQYSPVNISSIMPKTIEQQKNFLKAIINQDKANAILEQYPNIVEDVVNNKDNLNVDKIKGIGTKTWENIKEKILNNYGISEILALLTPLGVSNAIINRLIKQEPNIEILKEKIQSNPYMMTKVKGLGFKTVDALSLKINPKMKISRERVISYLWYFFEELGSNTGDTWVLSNILESNVINFMNECVGIYHKIIEEEKENPHFLKIIDNKIGLLKYYNEECEILDTLKAINDVDNSEKFCLDGESAIRKAEEDLGFEYTDEQKQVVMDCLNHNIVLISGYAGTGKSTILRAILNAYDKYNISCCALSAKASQRIKEATGRCSSTIHRLLGYDGFEFMANKENPLLCDLLVIDEASMINSNLFNALIKSVRLGSRIIICGDNGQLPPIGQGNVFNDLLNMTDEFKVQKLTKVLRQAEKSGVLVDANKIRNGIYPIEKPEVKILNGELKDMCYVFRNERETLNRLAIKTYLQCIQENGTNETVIIVPRKSNCVNSTSNINAQIQDIIIPEDVPKVEQGNKVLKLGAKVIQRVNNYNKNILNGEIGYITDIDIDKKMFSVEFNDDNDKKIIDYTFKESEELELAYALTVHLSQGSGYKIVIAIIDNSHYSLLDNCLLYTALTRTKEKCVLYSEPYAFKECLKNNKANNRSTWLSLKVKE